MNIFKPLHQKLYLRNTQHLEKVDIDDHNKCDSKKFEVVFKISE